MKCNDRHAVENHNQIQNQMSAAGLQGFTVQRLVFTRQTHDGDLSVGEHHAADRSCEQNYSEGEAVHVVNEHAVTGEFKQRGIITEGVCDQSPAAVQPDGQTEQNPHQNKSHPPGRNYQLDQHFVGHYGGVAQGITDGHISVEGHDNEHSASSGTEHVYDESLDHTLIISNDALRRRLQHVHKQTRQKD